MNKYEHIGFKLTFFQNDIDTCTIFICKYQENGFKGNIDKNWLSTNTVKLPITIDNSLQFVERLFCMFSSLSELWSTAETRLKHMIN